MARTFSSQMARPPRSCPGASGLAQPAAASRARLTSELACSAVGGGRLVAASAGGAAAGCQLPVICTTRLPIGGGLGGASVGSVILSWAMRRRGSSSTGGPSAGRFFFSSPNRAARAATRSSKLSPLTSIGAEHTHASGGDAERAALTALRARPDHGSAGAQAPEPPSAWRRFCSCSLALTVRARGAQGR